MKLYLSSYRLPDLKQFVQLVGKPAADIRFALIPNAKDFLSDYAKNYRVQDLVGYLRDRQLQADIVDLQDYTDEQTLKNKLLQYDVVWAMGGNTFCLRQAMRRSGFEKIISDVLEAGVVYGGDSAGALVAGTNLKGVEACDEPEYTETVIWEGLRLTNHFLLPHVGNKECGEDIEETRRIHGPDPTLIDLTDQQAFIVDGDRETVITADV